MSSSLSIVILSIQEALISVEGGKHVLSVQLNASVGDVRSSSQGELLKFSDPLCPFPT